jgi:hypothetical protein
MIQRQDTSSIKLKDTSKVSSEKISVPAVTRSIQEDRNDIRKVELHNKQLRSSQPGKTCLNSNKRIHETLQELMRFHRDLVSSRESMTMSDRLTLVAIVEKMLTLLLNLKTDPAMKSMIDNAQQLQNFDENQLRHMVNSEREVQSQTTMTLIEQEQLMT